MDILFKRIAGKFQSWLSNKHITRLARAVSRRSAPDPDQAPVVFFNASARLGYLSQNAAFSLLSAWGLRLSGIPIVHFVCKTGLSRCVLGTNPDDLSKSPPCASCIAQSQRLYANATIRWFSYAMSPDLETEIVGLKLIQLEKFIYKGIPLGEIVLPSLRWALRRHNLEDNESTRFLFCQYILSSYSLALEFDSFLDQVKPRAVVVFNGIMFPEAIARFVALKHKIRVITHEVGLLSLTAFFTDGQATAYPMKIPTDFQMNPEQNRRLDEYLNQRFQGDFSMAGIRFWPKMQELGRDFLEKANKFSKTVPVFTNVIFDTSQVHANSLFSDMFAWLDYVLTLMRSHPDVLFVIRAHPDEHRPGTRKQSRESVAQWVAKHGVDRLGNVIFVDSTEYLSSYALIEKAHFVLVYNSSIGLEASIMGKPVLCAGAARYTQYPTVFYPHSLVNYQTIAEDFLNKEQIEMPSKMVGEARRVLYYQLFITALPFSRYLHPHSRMGYVRLKSFNVEELLTSYSPAIRAIHAGVINQEPFLV